MSMIKLAYSPVIFLVLLFGLMLLQFCLPRFVKRKYGFILPVVYWLFSAKGMVSALRYAEPRKIPDYYLFSMLLSPGILFLLTFFIGFYYWNWKNKELKK